MHDPCKCSIDKKRRLTWDAQHEASGVEEVVCGGEGDDLVGGGVHIGQPCCWLHHLKHHLIQNSQDFQQCCGAGATVLSAAPEQMFCRSEPRAAF